VEVAKMGQWVFIIEDVNMVPIIQSMYISRALVMSESGIDALLV
jgi:hypothetical protein